MKTRIVLTIAFIFFMNTAAFSGVLIVNGLTHTYEGSSGDRVRGEIILQNTSNIDQLVTFDLNEAIFSCSEFRKFTKDMSHERSSLTWFEGNLGDKVLAPNERFVYRFSINIPEDATLKGSYWNMVMIQVEKPMQQQQSNAVALNSKMQYAVGVMTNVNNIEDLDLTFTSIDFLPEAGLPSKNLSVNLENENLFVEDVKLLLEIYDATGTKIMEKSTVRNLIFPGFCQEFIIDLTSLAKGNYQCMLIADSREEYVGANINLNIE